ncbi:MAG: DUF924 domain-containing protein [Sphingomonadales bacterium]|nr:DUF924 domain-containing protein [Sphingomonadales bacterium]MDE2569856.1 DUF924 domain-containing protein [Sphingomonadales bacterium]
MSAAQRRWAQDILHFWFGELRPAQRFARDDALDAELRRRFAPLLPGLSRQPSAAFLGDPLTARAAVLLFDQVPRNVFRDDRRAFALDPLARAITHGAIARGFDRGLSVEQRQFLYMPLMHSERIVDQRESLRRFTSLGSAYIIGFARAHYRMVARFGRFPHRNEVLGRMSTTAEARAVAAGNHW